MNLPKFGVEIECFLGESDNYLESKQKANEFLEKNHVKWNVKEDSSVSCEGFEFVSPILEEKEGLEEVKRVVNLLKLANFKVDHTCGLHVHVDARTIPYEKLIQTVLRYDNEQNVINNWLPSRRHKNKFASRLTDIERKALLMTELDLCHSSIRTQLGFRNTLFLNGFFSREKGCNLLSFMRHGTIEFRQHHGTLNSNRVIAWIDFCLNFCVSTWNTKGDKPLLEDIPQETIKSLMRI